MTRPPEPSYEAGAMHGIATNPHFPTEDRLRCALRALALYEPEVEAAEILRERIADVTAERDALRELLRRAASANGWTFAEVARINRLRCERWHPDFPNDGWSGADWSNAMQGEAGEAGNIVKKLRRIEFGLNQAAGDTRGDLLAKLATEIGDTFLYLDLLAQHYGLDLAKCVVDTFNRVSTREGFPEFLREPS